MTHRTAPADNERDAMQIFTNVVEWAAIAFLGWLAISVHTLTGAVATLEERTSKFDTVWTAQEQRQYAKAIEDRFHAVNDRLKALEE